MKNILLFMMASLAAAAYGNEPVVETAGEPTTTPSAQSGATPAVTSTGVESVAPPVDDATAATYIETSATLQLNGKVCGTQKGKMLSGVRSALTGRLEGVVPKTFVSIDVLPVIENGKIKYKMTILMEKANGDSSKVTADGITDPTVPLKYAFGKEGTAYNAEVIFTLAGNKP